MQTKKKVPARNSREVASPRVSRHQKKVPENGHTQAKKVTDLITSSARKQKTGRVISKDTEVHVAATDMEARFGQDDDASTVCLGLNTDNDINNAPMNSKGHGEGIVHEAMGTIFSPAFHVSRSVTGEISNRDFYEVFQHGDQDCEEEFMQVDLISGHALQDEEQLNTVNVKCLDTGSGLSSEVSAIYLTMKSSNLECVDEHNQDHMSTDEEFEEVDDFDPYFFIKTLPELSSIVPTFRPMLLPKQTRSCPPTTLVLDLDETLVHSTLEPCDDADFTFSVNFNMKDHTVYVRCRPHLRDFIERVSRLFEITIFTASQSIYAEQLLNKLDPKRKFFRHRVYRDSCVFVDGNYLKDLSVLGRDLARVIIIDNSPQAFGFQVDNGIPIESWFDDRSDQELLRLLPFLESLVGVEDVRPLIAEKFNLRGKIDAAVCPFGSNLGDPFER